MAVLPATLHSVTIEQHDSRSPLKVARVLFTVSGTYANADGISLNAINTAISSQTRNGKTVTAHAAAPCQVARKDSNQALMMGLVNCEVAGNNFTSTVSASIVAGAVDMSTALPDGAFPAQACPFGVLVSYTEA